VKPLRYPIIDVRGHSREKCRWAGGVGGTLAPDHRSEPIIRESVLEVLASRAGVELGRVAMVRPALAKRCERAEGILAGHVAASRAGLIRARVHGGELVGYLMSGSGGAVYRVEAKGSWRCSCPDHHDRHRRRAEGSRACKHALACWALWQAASGAQSPEDAAAAGELEREHGEASAEARAA
jgi:hypothetical protein